MLKVVYNERKRLKFSFFQLYKKLINDSEHSLVINVIMHNVMPDGTMEQNEKKILTKEKNNEKLVRKRSE